MEVLFYIRERGAEGYEDLQLQQTQLACAGNSLRPTGHTQLFEHVVNVPLGRADGDDKRLRDIGIRSAGGQQAEDFELAVGERVELRIAYGGLRNRLWRRAGLQRLLVNGRKCG